MGVRGVIGRRGEGTPPYEGRIATPACGLVRNDTIIPRVSRFWDVTFLTKRAMIKEKILRRKQI